MANSAQTALVEINTLSRQLLSRINDVQVGIQEVASTQSAADNDTNTGANDNQKFKKDLTELIAQRQAMIVSLFEKNSAEAIQAEATQLNEMVSLDTELSNKSQTCKQALAEQVIKIKKGKKVTHSYKKY